MIVLRNPTTSMEPLSYADAAAWRATVEARRRSNRRAAGKVALTTGILAALLACLGLYSQYGVLSKGQALEQWRNMFQSDWHQWWPKSYTVLRGNQTGGRDAEYWFLLQLPPADIIKYKHDIITELAPSRGYWQIDQGEQALRFELFQHAAPSWWRPERAGDAEFVRLGLCNKPGDGAVGGYHFFFSRKTGLVYVHRWDS